MDYIKEHVMPVDPELAQAILLRKLDNWKNRINSFRKLC